jgi:hypothetical protein
MLDQFPHLCYITFLSVSQKQLFHLYLNKFIDGNKLKKGFGWFVLIMGVYIVLKETVFAG